MKPRASPRETAPDCASIRAALLQAFQDALQNGALIPNANTIDADARADAESRDDAEKDAAARICAHEESGEVFAPDFQVRATWTAAPRDREYSRGVVRRVPTLPARNLKIEARGADFSSNFALRLTASGFRAAPVFQESFASTRSAQPDGYAVGKVVAPSQPSGKVAARAVETDEESGDATARERGVSVASRARTRDAELTRKATRENSSATGNAARDGENRANFGERENTNSARHNSEAARAVARVLATHYRGAGAPAEARGFLNFHLSDEELQSGVERALQAGEDYGAGDALAGKRIAVEFVSADPTGELAFSHAHDAALGDALCRLFVLQGASVTREFFVNDDPASSRMKLLGESVAAHYAALFADASTRTAEAEPVLREGTIDNAFVREAAKSIAQSDGDAHLLLPQNERAAAFSQRLSQRAVASQKAALDKFGVPFDEWISEQALLREGRIAFIIQRLAQRGHIVEKGGATWLVSSALGDESDRPLQRESGEFTYLATDLAYHAFKLERGFDLLINIWTAAHRTYIERTRIALRAAGYHEAVIEMIACDGARLLRDGAVVKRGNETPSLNDALSETDAATLRFSMLLRGWDETADFDLDAARRDDESNAAYAAQLLYSRLGTLLRESQAEAQAGTETPNEAREYSQLFSGDGAARDLARLIAQWPDAAQDAAQSRAPQRIARFVLEIAAAARALAASPEKSGGAARIELLQAAQITASAALRSLGIEPKERF